VKSGAVSLIRKGMSIPSAPIGRQQPARRSGAQPHGILASSPPQVEGKISVAHGAVAELSEASAGEAKHGVRSPHDGQRRLRARSGQSPTPRAEGQITLRPRSEAHRRALSRQAQTHRVALVDTTKPSANSLESRRTPASSGSFDPGSRSGWPAADSPCA